jgi:outer membrane biosynthesis protein TonB
MKAVQLIGTGALFLLLGTVAPAYAQEEGKPAKQEEKAQPARQEEKAKPAKQEEKAQPAKQEEKAKPAKQEEKAQPAKQEAKATPAKQEEKAQPAKQEAKATPAKQEEKAQPAKQEEHAKAAPQEHGQPQRTQQAQEKQRSEPALHLSSRGNSRIPDDRFRASFGREHSFRIDSPRIVDGYSRFQYSGFWFGFVQPWPDDWYYTDDVYVDFVDGGYYLYNPSYPDVRIEISVVL